MAWVRDSWNACQYLSERKMVFVGAGVFPHGTLPFDGDPNSESSSCLERHAALPENLKDKFSALYKSYVRLAEFIANKKPEIVILYTPHGISLTSGSAAIYTADVAKGNALWNNCWQEFEVEVPLDSERAATLLDHLQKWGVRADGISCFGKTEAPIRWGEVVPLWCLDKQLRSENVKYIIFTVGRKSEPKELQMLGEALQRFISSLSERVAVVMSGDLAHTHKHNCDIPLYLPGEFCFNVWCVCVVCAQCVYMCMYVYVCLHACVRAYCLHACVLCVCHVCILMSV